VSGLPGLRDTDARATAASIAAVQQPDGCIPWFRDGHADPWNHVEAAMGLDVGGHHEAAGAAYSWLARIQNPDGSWAAAYRDGRIVDGTLDANFCAYVAAGCWHHYLCTENASFLEQVWPAVERAIDFVLDLQAVDGSVWWARSPDHDPWPGALLASSSCIHLSLRCAVTMAEHIGRDRPDWELSLAALAGAVRRGDEGFEPKGRYSMDWYYPVLGGALEGFDAMERLAERWDDFVIEGRGVRCVSDRLWVTTGETCELALALDASGMSEEAQMLFGWVHHLRTKDGSYWTGATYPDGIPWPHERTTWSAGAVLLAWDALASATPAAGLFRGERLAQRVELSDPVSDSL
jgi:hypothetical protein